MSGLLWACRIAVFAVSWWILTAGDSGSWVLGVPSVLLAAWVSNQLQSEGRVRLSMRAAFRYAVFFVSQSIRGGIDVARRALMPGPRVSPYFLTYRTTLPEGWPRALLANTLSLLPGTLSADIDGDTLTIHALTGDLQPAEGVRACEDRLAAVFRLNGSASERARV